MSFGRLNTYLIQVANTDELVYTVSSNCKYAEIDIRILNSDVSNDATIEIAVATTVTPTSDEYIEKGAIVPRQGGILDEAGIIMSPDEIIIVKSSVAGVAVRISGKEIIE